MWIKTKRLTNAATAAYGLLGFVFERLLGFAHQASSPVISQKLDGAALGLLSWPLSRQVMAILLGALPPH
jgi:hypothetical protein